MKKYQNNLDIDYTKNIPYYETTLPSSIPQESVPFYYTTRIDERLDNISNKFYKTPNNWWIIAKANNLANGTIAVPGGTQLFIPNV
jgi:hypothetical protein